MGLQIYNTLTRRKEEFVPRDPGRVGVYQCGPTVYADTHVGHLRPLIVIDAIVRYLEYKGFTVTHVENFTDVDDKIIAKAREEGKDPSEVADRYVRQYLEIARKLGVRPAAHYPRVSEHIDEILEMIRGLLEKGYAYQVDGNVYFDVSKFEGYGKLSGRSTEDLLAGARVEIDDRKDDPLDFALWKAARPGEPSWPSPWGSGRPGWHIECSAMSLKYLGPGFDLHGGGADLIFPHHENEIAQSEAFLDGAPFVRYWVHNGMLRLDREKMSKSVGNIIRAEQVLKRYPPEVLRFFMLSVHYRSPQDYDEDSLEEARKGWERLAKVLEHLRELTGGGSSGDGGGDGVPRRGASPPTAELQDLDDQVTATKEKFEKAMDDDLNTALAIAALFDLARAVNSTVHNPRFKVDEASRPVLERARRIFEELGDVLGIFGLSEGLPSGEERTGHLVQLLLNIRAEARKNLDWTMADKIRDGLAEIGILVEDTPAGPRWRWR